MRKYNVPEELEMIGSQKAARLFVKLRERTTKGELEWQETSEENVFHVSVSEYFLQLAKRPASQTATSTGAEEVVLQIYDDKGRLVGTVDQHCVKKYLAAPSDLLSRFYDQVVRNVSGEEQAYDNLLTALDTSDSDAGR
jgi:hypothetical protein